jgi:serine O-acetyltransferase
MQFKYLKHDLYRYFYPNNQVSKISFFKKMQIIIFTQGIWALIGYRFMRWATCECKIPVIKQISKVIGAFYQLFIEITTGILIQPDIDIGPGLFIGHFGNIFIGGARKIGKICNISQENTIGYAGRGEKRGVPEIGDYVYVAPGAKIIGKIKIGNHVAIGANAVVTKNIPDNAVAVGVPAKVISYKSSRDFIEFNENKHKEIF